MKKAFFSPCTPSSFKNFKIKRRKSLRFLLFSFKNRLDEKGGFNYLFSFFFKYSFSTRLMYCDKDLSSFSANSFIFSKTSLSTVMLIFSFKGRISFSLFTKTAFHGGFNYSISKFSDKNISLSKNSDTVIPKPFANKITVLNVTVLFRPFIIHCILPC